MSQLFANNADSSLAAPISNVATTLTVASGDGAKFPAPTGSDYFLMTIFRMSGVAESGWEVVKVTNVTGDVMTVVRAQDGTAGGTYNTGDPVSLRWTKGGAENMMQCGNNLDDLTNTTVARSNLGLGTAAVVALTSLLQAANNLSELTAPATARSNLGLGTAAVVALTSLLQAANNLSELTVPATARSNLGLGTAAVHPVGDFFQVANNLVEITNTTAAQSALGLGSAATHLSTDFATSTQGTTADNALPKAGGTMTGDIAFGNKNASGLKSATFNSVIDDGTKTTTATIDFTTGQYHKCLLTASTGCTFTFTAPNGPCVVHLRIVQPSSGTGAVMTLPSGKWPGNYAAADKLLSTANNAIDMLVAKWDGSTWYYTLSKGWA
jgi:hypothetical protein